VAEPGTDDVCGLAGSAEADDLGAQVEVSTSDPALGATSDCCADADGDSAEADGRWADGSADADTWRARAPIEESTGADSRLGADPADIDDTAETDDWGRPAGE
jgi:hypothetical protein